MIWVHSKTEKETEVLTRSLWRVGGEGMWVGSGDNQDLSLQSKSGILLTLTMAPKLDDQLSKVWILFRASETYRIF